MKVKIFDENHEKDLEIAINSFLSSEEVQVVDIKYSVTLAVSGEEQLYCFSALIVYEKG